MTTPNQKKILIAPLDWGLGHATRCIPVVKEFLKQRCEVQIATGDNAFALLKKEFPDLKFHLITSYQAEYSRLIPLSLKILLQLPKFWRAIQQEHNETEVIIEHEKIDLVISDNRYGCWSQQIPSVFIGHQLNLRASVFSWLANHVQQKAIRKFSVCWVPDNEGEASLAGELTSTKLNKKHIGVLSRLQWRQSTVQYEIMAILSGPEPQRTIFEEIIMNELRQSRKRCLVVRGLPGQATKPEIDGAEIANHLSSQEMNEAMLESETIISRSGYSTIMDLAMLGKKAIFVPTPGQTEQVYLAARLAKKKIALAVRQSKFNLQEALNRSMDYSGFTRAEENSLLKEAIEQLLK